MPYRAPGQPRRSILVCHIPEGISAPAQMQNEPCQIGLTASPEKPRQISCYFQHCTSLIEPRTCPSTDVFWASSSPGRSRTPFFLLLPLGHPAQEHDSRELRQPPHSSGSNADGFRLTLPLAMSRWSRPLKPHFLEVGSQMESLPDRVLCLLSGGA